MKQQWHSGFDDSSGWGRLIDPVCLFILCQIAGTLWVIIPRKAFAPPVAPNASVEVQRTEAPGLMNQKSALEKAVALARQEVTTLSLPVQAAVTEKDRLTAQIRMEEQQVKELEAKLDELTRKEEETGRKVAAVPSPNSQLGTEAEQLGQQLASRQTEVKRLQLALEQTRGFSDGSGVGSPRVVHTKLNPKLVQLIGDRALPLDAENYQVETGYLADHTRAVQYTKKARGESAEEVALPGSKISAFLGKIDPSKEYLLCVLNNDSFRVFREVRTLARAKGIQVGWDTSYRTDGVLVFGLGSGVSNLPGPAEGR
jgi:hypothetical protein